MRTNQPSLLLGLTVVLAACAPSQDKAPPPAAPPLPFVADDYPAALAEARARDVPMFIESWAPW
jgi:hypothetical protein